MNQFRDKYLLNIEKDREIPNNHGNIFGDYWECNSIAEEYVCSMYEDSLDGAREYEEQHPQDAFGYYWEVLNLIALKQYDEIDQVINKAKNKVFLIGDIYQAIGIKELYLKQDVKEAMVWFVRAAYARDPYVLVEDENILALFKAAAIVLGLETERKMLESIISEYGLLTDGDYDSISAFHHIGEVVSRIKNALSTANDKMKEEVTQMVKYLASELLKVYPTLSRYDYIILKYTDLIRMDRDNNHYYAERGYAYFARWNKYKICGDLDNAGNDFRKAIELNKGNVFAYIGLADTLNAKGEYGEAEKAAETSLRLDRDNNTAYYILYEIYLNSNDKEKAVDAANKLLSLSKIRSPHFAMLANACNNAKEYKQAIKYCDIALQYDVNCIDAYKARIAASQATGDNMLVKYDKERIMELTKPHDQDEYDAYAYQMHKSLRSKEMKLPNWDRWDGKLHLWGYLARGYACNKILKRIDQYRWIDMIEPGLEAIRKQLATMYDENGDMMKAKHILEELSGKSPDKNALFALVQMYFDEGDYLRAIQECDRIKTNEPTEVDYIRLIKGHSLFRLFKYRDAIRCYDQVVENAKSDRHVIDALFNRGCAYMELGDYNRGLDEMKLVLKKDERHPYVFYNIAFALDKLGQKEDALRCFKIAAERGIDTALKHINKSGEEYVSFAMMKHAETSGVRYEWKIWFRKAFELESLADSCFHMGLFVEEEFNTERLHCLDRVLAECPGNNVAIFKKARILRRLGHHREALDLLLTLSGSNINSEVLKERGEIHDILEQYDEAYQCFINANKLDPGNEEIRNALHNYAENIEEMKRNKKHRDGRDKRKDELRLMKLLFGNRKHKNT
ncbi:MAG: tetratricopeptide repeat protein [Endomicrobiales bacterium]|nr:tetratricopeptide repeat protein [Endomicrobiales bacterium]